MSVIDLFLLCFTGLSFLAQMIYYWFVFARLAFFKDEDKESDDRPPVSIVMSARNEYHNLIKNIPIILQQDYPDFEVIVVNHASNDESELYLKEIQQTDKRLHVVQIDRELNFFTGKKFPLSLGIKSAKNEILLLTDADCVPNSNNWIQSVVQNYNESSEVVLGYGPYKRSKGFVNKLVRYDTFFVAMQYLSFAIAGIPYMGVGRNLSYKRSMFFRNKGFTSHYRISSGDDDLFINQVANKGNTRVVVNKDSFMYSEAKKSFGEWIKQKQRHVSTGKVYKFKFKILLGTFSFTQLTFFIGIALMFIFWIQPIVAGSLLLVRVFTQFLVHKKILKRFEDGQLLIFSLLWELFHILLLQSITLISLFRKPVKWK